MLSASLITASAAHAADAEIGAAAPAFEVQTASGKTVSLDSYAGKVVVLEWTNKDCPYVRKHYDTGNMQAIQEEATADGIVWLQVISSAPGKQGHLSAEDAMAQAKSEGAEPTEILLDESGEMGRAYGAKTTPHMYVIDADGTLIYKGGIDDKPSANPATIEGANNYVRAALEAVEEGRAVEDASTRPYGCSVKYG